MIAILFKPEKKEVLRRMFQEVCEDMKISYTIMAFSSIKDNEYGEIDESQPMIIVQHINEWEKISSGYISEKNLRLRLSRANEAYKTKDRVVRKMLREFK